MKARLFVMTLRDHYKERAESATMSSFSPRGGGSQRSDDWAFEFINAKYLQPIMEAFDDDGSGYVTYQEVNDFVDERPVSLDWRCVDINYSSVQTVRFIIIQPPPLGCLLGHRVADHRQQVPH